MRPWRPSVKLLPDSNLTGQVRLRRSRGFAGQPLKADFLELDEVLHSFAMHVFEAEHSARDEFGRMLIARINERDAIQSDDDMASLRENRKIAPIAV